MHSINQISYETTFKPPGKYIWQFKIESKKQMVINDHMEKVHKFIIKFEDLYSTEQVGKYLNENNIPFNQGIITGLR